MKYGFSGRAPKVTNVAAAQTDQAIESGRTITLYKVLLSNSSGSNENVVFEKADGTSLFTLSAASGTTPIDLDWLCDAGLQITTGANTTCVLFHSQGGA